MRLTTHLTAAGSETPRPLSTIRTSFVAVEKDGRIGLQRDTSRDSSVSTTRKVSGEADVQTPPALNDKSNVFEKMDSITSKTSLREQPIPESPRTDSVGPVASQSPKKVPVIKLASQSLPSVDKPLGAANAEPRLGAATSSKGHVNGNGIVASVGVLSEKKNDSVGAKDKDKDKMGEKATFRGHSKNSNTTPSTSKATTKILPVSTPKSVSKAPKSPAVANAPKSPVAAVPKLAAKATGKNTLHPEKAAVTPKTNASAPKVGASPASVKKPPPLHHHSGIGFVKPKVKSPTRPVKLPSSLTTHTAASGSKVNPSRQSSSRASGTLQTVDSLGRSPSRISVSTTTTSAPNASGTGHKTLKRQSSNLNPPRPSLGPPPKPKAKEYPPTRKEREIDEGFLARMMRPTQASSSKTNEKAPLTPPRKKVAPRASPRSEVKAAPKFVAVPTKTEIPVPSETAAAPAMIAQDIAVIVNEPPTDSVAAEADLPRESSATVVSAVEQAGTAEEVISIVQEAEGAASADNDHAAVATQQELLSQDSMPETELIDDKSLASDGDNQKDHDPTVSEEPSAPDAVETEIKVQTEQAAEIESF